MIWIKGFLLIDCLVALAIISAMMPLLVTSLNVLSKNSELNYQVGNMKDIYLLQRKLAFSTDIASNSLELYFNYEDRDYTLKQIDDHLVLTPGAQYFALEVEHVAFYINGNVWFMDIVFDSMDYTIPLAYAF